MKWRRRWKKRRKKNRCMLFCVVGGESKEDFLASLVHGSSISCGGKLPLLALSPLQELHRAMNVRT